MSGVKKTSNIYLSDFERLEKKMAAAGAPAWLGAIRKSAIERFAELDFPTTRVEEWKYTNVDSIARVPFLQTAGSGEDIAPSELDRAPLGDMGCPRFVVVDGHYSAPLSSVGAVENGIRIGSLASFVASGDPVVKSHLARHADYAHHAFVALNTAFITDGFFVEIPDRAVLQKPIYLLFVSTGKDAETVSHTRTLVIAGRDCQATIIEGYIGLGTELYLTNAVTEIVAGENSTIDHYKLQQEAAAAFHVATLQVSQHRSSSFYDHSIALGGRLVRNDIKVLLDGEGAECTLDGLYVENETQHVDNHTLVDHAKPHGTSRELYKGILDGRSTGVFNGSVIVREDAQKTDALQSNKNLLLSETSEINTKPQLEIFADDVKCSHGATIGQIDQEAVFYLRSRGIGLEEARNLLTYAFTNEIIERMKSEAVRSHAGKAIFARLSGTPKTDEVR